MSMSCPPKKTIIENKSKRKKKQETYAKIATSNHQEYTTPKINQIMSDKTNLSVIALFMHAHLMNIINPSCFEIELNKVLKMNGL